MAESGLLRHADELEELARGIRQAVSGHVPGDPSLEPLDEALNGVRRALAEIYRAWTQELNAETDAALNEMALARPRGFA